MSDPTTPATPADTSAWDTIVADAQNVLTILSPLLSAVPVPGVALGLQIAQGVLSANTPAEALYKQFVSGTPPTAEQIAAFQSQYEADDDKLAADIPAAIAKETPPA